MHLEGLEKKKLELLEEEARGTLGCASRNFSASLVACVAGGSGYGPRGLRSRTLVQKAAQVTRRMGRSLKVSRAHPLPPATQATSQVLFKLPACTINSIYAR